MTSIRRYATTAALFASALAFVIAETAPRMTFR